MPFQFGASDRTSTQIAISEALDHALEYGDDMTALELAQILRGMTPQPGGDDKSRGECAIPPKPPVIR